YSLEREWTAQSLGASRWQRFLHVELPIMRRPLFLAVLITVGYSLGEVSTILLFSPMGIRTLALGIFQSMSRYRFQEAHAITVILLLVMLIVFGVAGFLEDSDE
ncbi:MAG: ABC transporter permease subunit, partial [Proteobacteria bacterium]|nr:ABC transporter permease subunit [Pseudomonadota bacterium]